MADVLTTHGGDFERASRQYARKCAELGFAALAQAFNHCDCDYHPHRYAPDVQERFRELMLEIVGLVESGRIEPNAGHADYLRAQEAKKDATLQAVLKRAGRKTPIRRRDVGGPAGGHHA
jgi:hypothetical protein